MVQIRLNKTSEYASEELQKHKHVIQSQLLSTSCKYRESTQIGYFRIYDVDLLCPQYDK